MSVRGSVGGSGHPGTLRAVVLYIVLHAFRMPLLYSSTPLGPGEAEGCKGRGDWWGPGEQDTLPDGRANAELCGLHRRIVLRVAYVIPVATTECGGDPGSHPFPAD